MNIFLVTVNFTIPLVSSDFYWNSRNKTFVEKYKILAKDENSAMQIASNLAEKSFSGMIGYISYSTRKVD